MRLVVQQRHSDILDLGRRTRLRAALLSLGD
jgi:hypothetical protein